MKKVKDHICHGYYFSYILGHQVKSVSVLCSVCGKWFRSKVKTSEGKQGGIIGVGGQIMESNTDHNIKKRNDKHEYR